MTAAVARDPRVGLRPNLDFLEAYQIYEKDFPLPKPDISATLAIRSPLFKRIEEGLTEQTRAIAEHQSDQATTRRAATESGVPVTSLAQMLASLTPPAAPPTTLPDTERQVREARRMELVAERQRLIEDQVVLLRDRANANDVNARLAQQQQSGIQQLVTQMAQAAPSPTTVVVQQASPTTVVVQAPPTPPPGTTVNVDNRSIVFDNRALLQQAIDGRTSLDFTTVIDNRHINFATFYAQHNEQINTYARQYQMTVQNVANT